MESRIQWLTWLPILLALVFGGVALSRRRRGEIRLGFSLDWKALAEFGVGLGIGALAMAGVFGVEWGLDLIRVTQVQPEGINLLGALVTLAALAWLEELLFRVLMLNGLLALIHRAWIAVVVTAVAFGLGHADNPNATALSALSNALGGVMYALAYLGTGRIWMPWGLHLAWNYVQGPVFGFPISGTTNYSRGLIAQDLAGSALLTGGDYGPEGGLIGIGFRFLVIGLVVAWTQRGESG